MAFYRRESGITINHGCNTVKSRRGRPRSTKTDSEQKRAKTERNQRYRQKTAVVSITAEDAGEIRRIGEEEGLSDKEVVALLI